MKLGLNPGKSKCLMAKSPQGRQTLHQGNQFFLPYDIGFPQAMKDLPMLRQKDAGDGKYPGEPPPPLGGRKTWQPLAAQTAIHGHRPRLLEGLRPWGGNHTGDHTAIAEIANGQQLVK
jgi:hypothetical protein